MNKSDIQPIGVLEGNSKEYEVAIGWSTELADILVRQSKEQTIQQWTPNDALKRFATRESAEAWYRSEKSPVVYTLGLSEVSLAGLAWFSRQQHPDTRNSSHTFAIRMYSEGRGQRLSLPFAEMVHTDFIRERRPQGIWLETHKENNAAKSLYRKLGYQVLSTVDDRMTMIRQV